MRRPSCLLIFVAVIGNTVGVCLGASASGGGKTLPSFSRCLRAIDGIDNILPPELMRGEAQWSEVLLHVAMDIQSGRGGEDMPTLPYRTWKWSISAFRCAMEALSPFTAADAAVMALHATRSRSYPLVRTVLRDLKRRADEKGVDLSSPLASEAATLYHELATMRVEMCVLLLPQRHLHLLFLILLFFPSSFPLSI